MKPCRPFALIALLLSSGAALAQGAPPPGGPPPMPSMAETHYLTAIEVRDGALAQPVAAIVQGGTALPTAARDVSITSDTEALNALFVSGGRSAFTLRDSVIALAGAGTNDFLGTGAGALVRDGATLVLDNVTIETNGRIAPAVVAAENATLRIYRSRLVANGGPLPENYVPRIGPGMMEPPPPLGLTGTARTVLAMSNSRTFLYDSHIEADGWGALSTDATGGNLYLEANDCTVVVRRAGYGTYADFGAHVVVNRSRIDSGAHQGIIAGKARTDYNGVTGHAAGSTMMIHSVMAFDPAETAEFSLADSNVSTGGPVILVKSANAVLTISNTSAASAAGVLLEVRKNDDPNATQTHGATVPGVSLLVRGSVLAGDVLDTDPDRATDLRLKNSTLTGALHDVRLALGDGGRWLADGDSTIVVADAATLAGIDATAGVTVTAGGAGVTARALPSGGRLVPAHP